MERRHYQNLGVSGIITSMAQYILRRSEWRRWRDNRRILCDVATGARMRAMSVDEVIRYEAAQINGNLPTIHVEGTACKVVQDREHMRAEIFEKVGRCHLKQPTGKFIEVIKGDEKTTPYNPHYTLDVALPEHCDCAVIGDPHPGRHHPLCPSNRKAPPEHRATPEDYAKANRSNVLELAGSEPLPATISNVLPPGVEVIRNPAAERKAPSQVVTNFDLPAQVVENSTSQNVSTSTEVRIPEPSECMCKDFPGPNPDPGKQHNVLCEHYESWLNTHPLDTTYMLVKSGTFTAIREATADEVKQAALDIARVVRLDDHIYQVHTQKELEQLQATASKYKTPKETSLDDSENEIV